jgi:hypothetical protein
MAPGFFRGGGGSWYSSFRPARSSKDGSGCRGAAAGGGLPWTVVGRGVARGARGRPSEDAGAAGAGAGAAGGAPEAGAFFFSAKALPQLGQAILPSAGKATSGIG